MRVEPAGRSDVPEVAAALARAFQEDPNFVALFPNAGRRPRVLARLFTAELREARAFETSDMVRIDGRVAGAAVWYPPGSFPMPAWARLRGMPAALALMASYPSAARPMLGLVERLDENRPREPHWYLGTVGVDPAHHGTGVGAALLAHGLARVDREGGPAYLETATERNARWYERLGFETTGRAQLVERGGPLCWLMWRQARRPAP